MPEPDVRRDPVLVGATRDVRLDLVAGRVVLRPLGVRRERVRVEEVGDVDPQTGVVVLPPGPADGRVLVEDRVADPQPAQPDRHGDPGEAGPDDRDVEVGQRVDRRRARPHRLTRIGAGEVALGLDQRHVVGLDGLTRAELGDPVQLLGRRRAHRCPVAEHPGREGPDLRCGGVVHRGRVAQAEERVAVPAVEQRDVARAVHERREEHREVGLLERGGEVHRSRAGHSPSYGTVKCSSRTREGAAGAELRALLHEVELVLLEAEVRGERVHERAGGLLPDVGVALLDEGEPGLGDGESVGRHAGDPLRPPLGAPGDVGVVDHLGEQAEVLDRRTGDELTRVEEPPGHHRAQPVEEEVQVAERGTEELRAGHPELGAPAHHREVAHERDLEPAAERVALDLADGDLRVVHEVVVEAEAVAVDRQAPPLAGAALGPVGLLVPGVGVGHVGPGAEHPVGAPEEQDLHVVVGRDLVEVPAHLLAHGRVVRVLPGRLVDGEPGDVAVAVDLEVHAAVALVRHPTSRGNICMILLR